MIVYAFMISYDIIKIMNFFIIYLLRILIIIKFNIEHIFDKCHIILSVINIKKFKNEIC